MTNWNQCLPTSPPILLAYIIQDSRIVEIWNLSLSFVVQIKEYFVNKDYSTKLCNVFNFHKRFEDYLRIHLARFNEVEHTTWLN